MRFSVTELPDTITKKTAKIDWFAGTFLPGTDGYGIASRAVKETGIVSEEAAYDITLCENWAFGGGGNGYNHGLKGLHYEEIRFNAPVDGMGVHVILPGNIVTESRVYNAIALGCRTSRLDLAVDVHVPTDFDIETFYTELCAKRYKSRMKDYSITKSKTGSTVYVGSWKSDRLLRLYDKGAEQGEQPRRWLRAEVKMKGARAHEVARQLVRGNDTVFFASRIVSGCIRWTDTELDRFWKQWTSEEGLTISTPRPERNTSSWLLSVVPPLVAREMEKDENVLEQLLSRIERERERVRENRAAARKGLDL